MRKNVSKKLHTVKEIQSEINNIINEALDWEVFDVENSNSDAEYGEVNIKIIGKEEGEGYMFKVIVDNIEKKPLL
jgi:hypothetical protein